MVKLLMNTKLSNATNALSYADWITSVIKKATTGKTTSFGSVVIADD